MTTIWMRTVDSENEEKKWYVFSNSEFGLLTQPLTFDADESMSLFNPPNCNQR